MLNIGVFASGNGSNFRAIHRAISDGRLDAAIRLVLSNNSQAGALAYAREQELPAVHFSTKTVPDETRYAGAMLELCAARGVEFIALAGYMKLLPTEMVRAYRRRILNIHPALLPRFGGPGMYGMRVHEAVIAAGVPESGATVHVVDEAYDHGAIVLQKSIPVLPGETPESLAARVLEIEHEIYPEALSLFAAGRIRFDGDTIIIT